MHYRDANVPKQHVSNARLKLNKNSWLYANSFLDTMIMKKIGNIMFSAFRNILHFIPATRIVANIIVEIIAFSLMLNLRATRNDSILTSFHSNYQLKVIEQMFVDEKCFLSLLKKPIISSRIYSPT